MTDENLRFGHNASQSGYQHQWSNLLDVWPYDRAVYGGYFAMLEEMFGVLAEGARILQNPAWASAIHNFRAAHADNLQRFTADMYPLRDRLPDHGYEAIKRAVLGLRHERARGVGSVPANQDKSD